MLVIIDSQLSQFVLNSIQMVGAKLKVTCKEGDIIIFTCRVSVPRRN